MRDLIMCWRVASLGRVVIGGVLLVLFFAHAAHADTVTVTVEWDPPEDPTVIGYLLSYGPSPGSYTLQTDVGNVISSVVEGISDTESTYFIVQSYDSSGNLSEPSEEVMYTSFSITCRITYAVSTDGNPVEVTLESPTIVGGTPPPESADCTPPSGSLFEVGDTPVTCTASDDTRSVSCDTVVSVSYEPSNTFTPTATPTASHVTASPRARVSIRRKK